MMTEQYALTPVHTRTRTAIAFVVPIVFCGFSAAAFSQESIGPLAGAGEQPAIDILAHMPQDLRDKVQKVVVISTQRPAGQDVSGTYEKDTAGLLGGIEAGRRMGTISKQVGPVPVYIPIPILTIPGAIFGGLTGAAKREIQEFRDDLTEDLSSSESQPLKDDGLALDVFWNLRKLPQLDSKIYSPTTEIAADTQATLHVTFDNVGIDVQGKHAVITTAATASLRPRRGGAELFHAVIHYEDRDTLRNWTENDNQLWHNYANFARHYLGREISAVVFDRVQIVHELQPLETKTAKRDRKIKRQLRSKSTRPTLAWQLTLPENGSDGPWPGAIDETNLFYDIEIYDPNRLVYFEEQLPDPQHTLAMDLEGCQTYRWSVRPSYHVNGEVHFGEWMRFAPETEESKKSKRHKRDKKAPPAEAPAEQAVLALGIFGRQASAAPAYTQDFPALQIDCN